MNGFQAEIQSKLFGISEHVVVRFYEPRDANLDLARFTDDQRIKVASPFLISAGIIQHAGVSVPSVLLGIDPAQINYATLLDNTDAFSHLHAGEFQAITGGHLAQSIAWSKGRKAMLLSAPRPGQMMNHVNMKRIALLDKVTFKTGKRLEEKMIFMHLNDVQLLMGLPGKISGFNLHLHDLYQAPDVAYDVAQNLGQVAYVSDWTEQYSELFSALRLQKTVMVILLGLIIVIALFNLVTGQVMLVNERRTSIAVLATCGMTRSRITAIFILQGLFLACIGIVIGTALGFFVANHVGDWVRYVESTYHIQLISSKVYMVDYLPCDFRWSDACTIALMTLLFTFICSAYPAKLAGRIHPARTLRYE